MSTDLNSFMTNNRLIPITDHKGNLIVSDDEEVYEPHPASIVLTSGQFGTAWQKHFDDGLWYRASKRGQGGGKTWAELCTYRQLVLVYDAVARP